MPPGPDGRPGERLLSTSRSLYAPRKLGPDGSREDFRVVVGRGASTFAAVCLGRVADVGGPRDSAWHSIRELGIKGCSASPVVDEEVAGTEGCRYSIALNSGLLTEWKFAHAGWLFVAGVLHWRPDDGQVVLDRARSILATWRWV